MPRKMSRSRPLNVSVSVSSRSRQSVERSRSQSRLGLKIKCLGLVSVSDPKVSFTSLDADANITEINILQLICHDWYWHQHVEHQPRSSEVVVLALRAESHKQHAAHADDDSTASAQPLSAELLSSAPNTHKCISQLGLPLSCNSLPGYPTG